MKLLDLVFHKFPPGNETEWFNCLMRDDGFVMDWKAMASFSGASLVG
jgi:hypothetical protein